jgi:hypothetical protein
MWSLAGNEISENPKLMKTPMRNLFIALAIFAGICSAGAQVNYAPAPTQLSTPPTK